MFIFFLTLQASGRITSSFSNSWRGSGNSSYFFPAPTLGASDQVLWDLDPASLVGRVGMLENAVGSPGSAWGKVLSKWRSTPPQLNGEVTVENLADFMRALLTSDPFGTGRQVPHTNFFQPGVPAAGKVVAVTQRQLAFIVTNVLMGNNIPGGNGLSAALTRCKEHTTPIMSLLSFLATLSREIGNGPGTTLIGTSPHRASDSSWQKNLNNRMSGLEICTDLNGKGSTCAPTDFMEGGTHSQALVDIAGGVVGGGAQLCDLADSQDESLVQFYSEVLAFAFYTGSSTGTDMLPTPFTLLGSRRYLATITGETSQNKPQCGEIKTTNWVNQNPGTASASTTVDGRGVQIYKSAYVAVASGCSGCTPGCTMSQLQNNQCDHQRRDLDSNVNDWYTAFAFSQYDSSVQSAFKTVVTRIGTGPWGSGVWWGDSQMYFLMMWIATSLLPNIQLDYYIYDHFCENPGNQCFVLGDQGCSQCILSGKTSGWIHTSACGQSSIYDVKNWFQSLTVQEVYNKAKGVGSPPKQVFDGLPP